MNLRNAVRLSSLLLAVTTFGCTDDGYDTTDPSTQFQVTPLYWGIDQGIPVQFSATIGANPVAVTWESSNPAVATVNGTGLVTTLTGGFTAITATQTANSAKKKSASLTVFPLLGVGLTNGLAQSVGGAVGDYILYRIYVPAGKTNLAVTMSGGTGDLDVYVQRGTPPTTSVFQCRSWNGGNGENCTIPNPPSGTWYILIDVYTAGAGASLTATVTP
jgi:serine protease